MLDLVSRVMVKALTLELVLVVPLLSYVLPPFAAFLSFSLQAAKEACKATARGSKVSLGHWQYNLRN